MKVTKTIVGVIATFFMLVGIPLAWIIRDGLGPDAMESSGMDAILKTLWTFQIGPLVAFFSAIWLILFALQKKTTNTPSS